MPRTERLTEQQLLERRKRIPARTQRTLNEMIRRRFAELSGQPAMQNHGASPQVQSALEKG